MTRADFIQRAMLGYMATPTEPPVMSDHALKLALGATDALEKSGVAPWDDADAIIAQSRVRERRVNQVVSENVASEREACAQIAGRYGAHAGALDAARAANEIAVEIRARGTT